MYLPGYCVVLAVRSESSVRSFVSFGKKPRMYEARARHASAFYEWMNGRARSPPV